MKLWVDPPQGYLYGFPKVWDDEVDGDCEAWMIAQGYPRYPSIDLIKYTRMWEYREE